LSYFKDITKYVITNLFQFQTPAVGVQNAIKCKDGKMAAWEYWKTDSDGNYLLKIYDVTSGSLVQIATVYAVAGRDLFCGLFTTGAIPSGDIFDSSCVFYRIDYI
jgi:hypothetical protein